MAPGTKKAGEVFTTWIPLEAALVWIATRDAKRTLQKIKAMHQLRPRRKMGELHDAGQLEQLKWQSRIDDQDHKIRTNAWNELRGAIARGAVVARGFRTAAQFDWYRPAWLRASEAQKLTGASQLVIPSIEMDIVLYKDTHPLVDFIPWKGVIVSQEDLLQVFPTRSSAATVTTVLPQGKNRKVQSVVLALESLTDSDGNLPAWSDVKRFEVVNNWLGEHGYETVANTCVKNGKKQFDKSRK